MDHGQPARAYAVYDLLLDRQPGRKVRALALYYQAEVKRRRGEWPAALKKYKRLLSEQETGLESAGQFGLAVCYRELDEIGKARQCLKAVDLSPTDPLVAHYHLEMGLLDFAEEKYRSASTHLMRVGLLYDNEALCGRALLKAYEACRRMGDERKALICLNELAGIEPETYGRRYPKSAYAVKGKDLLDVHAKSGTLQPVDKLPDDQPPAAPELDG